MQTFSKLPKEDFSPLLHQRKASVTEKMIEKNQKKEPEIKNQHYSKYVLGDDINGIEEHNISKELEFKIKLETPEEINLKKKNMFAENQEKIYGQSGTNPGIIVKKTYEIMKLLKIKFFFRNSIHKKTLSISYTPNILQTEARLFDKNHSQKLFSKEQSRFLNEENRKSTLSLRYSFKTLKGFSSSNLSKPNQDSFIASPNFSKSINQYLFSICDGHGPEGHLVSQFIKEEFPSKY